MKAEPSVLQGQVENKEEDGLERQDGQVDPNDIPAERIDVDILVKDLEDVRLDLVEHDHDQTLAQRVRREEQERVVEDLLHNLGGLWREKRIKWIKTVALILCNICLE